MSDISDVRWSHADAAAASAALRWAAGELRRAAGERASAAQAATAEWRGVHRETFDDQLRRAVAEAEELASRYEAAARQIDAASGRARDEQRRRERRREELRQQAG